MHRVDKNAGATFYADLGTYRQPPPTTNVKFVSPLKLQASSCSLSPCLLPPLSRHTRHQRPCRPSTPSPSPSRRSASCSARPASRARQSGKSTLSAPFHGGMRIPERPLSANSAAIQLLLDARLSDDEEEQPSDPHPPARGPRHAAQDLRAIRYETHGLRTSTAGTPGTLLTDGVTVLRLWKREGPVARGPDG